MTRKRTRNWDRRLLKKKSAPFVRFTHPVWHMWRTGDILPALQCVRFMKQGLCVIQPTTRGFHYMLIIKMSFSSQRPFVFQNCLMYRDQAELELSRPAWGRLGVPRDEPEEVVVESVVWASLLRLSQPRISRSEWMDGHLTCFLCSIVMWPVFTFYSPSRLLGICFSLWLTWFSLTFNLFDPILLAAENLHSSQTSCFCH